jgi:hypothetical protein
MGQQQRHWRARQARRQAGPGRRQASSSRRQPASGRQAAARGAEPESSFSMSDAAPSVLPSRAAPPPPPPARSLCTKTRSLPLRALADRRRPPRTTAAATKMSAPPARSFVCACAMSNCAALTGRAVSPKRDESSTHSHRVPPRRRRHTLCGTRTHTTLTQLQLAACALAEAAGDPLPLSDSVRAARATCGCRCRCCRRAGGPSSRTDEREGGPPPPPDHQSEAPNANGTARTETSPRRAKRADLGSGTHNRDGRDRANCSWPLATAGKRAAGRRAYRTKRPS